MRCAGLKKLDVSEPKQTVGTARTPLRKIPYLFDSFGVKEPSITEPAFQVCGCGRNLVELSGKLKLSESFGSRGMVIGQYAFSVFCRSDGHRDDLALWTQ